MNEQEHVQSAPLPDGAVAVADQPMVDDNPVESVEQGKPPKKASKRNKKARSVKRQSAPSTDGRARKVYRLARNIPEGLRPESAGLAILEVLKARGPSTGKEIRAALPKMPSKTIGFYLGKFQRNSIVRAK